MCTTEQALQLRPKRLIMVGTTINHGWQPTHADTTNDSGENEVEKAVDELSEVASAVVSRHALMAMGTWLSILMLTSRHLTWAIREIFA